MKTNLLLSLRISFWILWIHQIPWVSLEYPQLMALYYLVNKREKKKRKKMRKKEKQKNKKNKKKEKKEGRKEREREREKEKAKKKETLKKDKEKEEKKKISKKNSDSGKKLLVKFDTLLKNAIISGDLSVRQESNWVKRFVVVHGKKKKNKIK